MWREYRTALEELIGADDETDLAELLAEMQSEDGDATQA
jgi:hypothetical protein